MKSPQKTLDDLSLYIYDRVKIFQKMLCNLEKQGRTEDPVYYDLEGQIQALKDVNFEIEASKFH